MLIKTFSGFFETFWGINVMWIIYLCGRISDISHKYILYNNINTLFPNDQKIL